MEKINLNGVLNKAKVFVKHFMFYVVFLLSLTTGFAVGYYYNTLATQKKTNITKPEVILRQDVSLAIDDSNNMLVINKKDGTYILYQDSIGYTIFNFYAKNIWGQHTNPTQTKK